MLPEVRPSSELYGEASSSRSQRIPIAGIAGDQQAAFFGQRCTTPGLTKNTYGTGCFLLQNTGNRAVASTNRLLTTVAWRSATPPNYALEGSVFVGGAVVQWLRDGLGIIRKSSDVEALATSVPDNGGVYFVPAFVGLGAPHWDPYARGAIFGLTRGSPRATSRAPRWKASPTRSPISMDAVQTDTGTPLTGTARGRRRLRQRPLMQFQADILGVPVVRPAMTETTALGAAFLAGLGLVSGKRSSHFLTRRRTPVRAGMPRSQVNELRARWNEAVARAKSWKQVQEE